MDDMQLTVQDDRTLEEFLTDYEQQKQDVLTLREQYAAEISAVTVRDEDSVEQLDMVYSQMTDMEKEVYDDFSKSQIFMKDVASALAFTKASTSVRLEQNEGYDGLECVSLMESPTEYGETIAVLSGGFNSEWNKALNETAPFEAQTTTPVQFEANALAPKEMIPEVQQAITEISGDNPLHNITVGDVVNTLSDTQKHMEKYNISPENAIDDTLRVVRYADIGLYQMQSFGIESDKTMVISAEQAAELYQQGYRADHTEELASLDLSIAQTMALTALLREYEENGINAEAMQKAEEALKEENVPVEIVESFDGYVMNANQQITADNIKEFEAKVEDDGKTVIHNEAPMETTIDPAEVGGRVKLEEYDDIGTMEKADGELTYEEKEAIADEKETQEEAEEAKSKKKESMERD